MCVCVDVEPSQYSNIWRMFTPGRVDERRGVEEKGGDTYGEGGWGTVFTVGESIRGGGGEGCAQPGGFWGRGGGRGD